MYRRWCSASSISILAPQRRAWLLSTCPGDDARSARSCSVCFRACMSARSLSRIDLTSALYSSSADLTLSAPGCLFRGNHTIWRVSYSTPDSGWVGRAGGIGDGSSGSTISKSDSSDSLSEVRASSISSSMLGSGDGTAAFRRLGLRCFFFREDNNCFGGAGASLGWPVCHC